ncbi:MAG TPA: ornithine carbamoyltransferase, partial [Bacillota bacterium]|nr:ornithine carbamoyltransferase [Bacillota bacterium]
VVRDPKEAARGADILYTDVWASMGMEAEQEKRKKDFQGYCIDQEIVDAANPDCIVLHCLPAHRGEEITHEVMEGSHSAIWDEAENRLHVQKAILALVMS